MEKFSIFDSVMEAGDHFKSGASSKSRMSNCTNTQQLIMNVVQKHAPIYELYASGRERGGENLKTLKLITQ